MATNGLNRVSLIGVVGSSPRMNYSPKGFPLTRLPLAVTDATEDAESPTEWMVVEFEGNLAEQSARLEKGTSVYVEARIHNHSRSQSSPTLSLRGTRIQVLSLPRQKTEAAPFAQFSNEESSSKAKDDALPF